MRSEWARVRVDTTGLSLSLYLSSNQWPLKALHNYGLTFTHSCTHSPIHTHIMATPPHYYSVASHCYGHAPLTIIAPLTVIATPEALTRPPGWRWKAAAGAPVPPAHPITSTMKSPEGAESKRARKSPPSRASRVPFTPPDPAASTSLTELSEPGSEVSVSSSVRLPTEGTTPTT